MLMGLLLHETDLHFAIYIDLYIYTVLQNLFKKKEKKNQTALQCYSEHRQSRFFLHGENLLFSQKQKFKTHFSGL